MRCHVSCSMSVKDREFVDTMEVISEEEVPKEGDSLQPDDELDFDGTPGHHVIIERLASRFPRFSRLMSVSSVRSGGSRAHSVRRNSSMFGMGHGSKPSPKLSRSQKVSCQVTQANSLMSVTSDSSQIARRRRSELHDSMTICSDNVDSDHEGNSSVRGSPTTPGPVRHVELVLLTGA